jgi:hypothetical protein
MARRRAERAMMTSGLCLRSSCTSGAAGVRKVSEKTQTALIVQQIYNDSLRIESVVCAVRPLSQKELVDIAFLALPFRHRLTSPSVCNPTSPRLDLRSVGLGATLFIRSLIAATLALKGWLSDFFASTIPCALLSLGRFEWPEYPWDYQFASDLCLEWKRPTINTA